MCEESEELEDSRGSRGSMVASRPLRSELCWGLLVATVLGALRGFVLSLPQTVVRGYCTYSSADWTRAVALN